MTKEIAEMWADILCGYAEERNGAFVVCLDFRRCPVTDKKLCSCLGASRDCFLEAMRKHAEDE